MHAGEIIHMCPLRMCGGNSGTNGAIATEGSSLSVKPKRERRSTASRCNLELSSESVFCLSRTQNPFSVKAGVPLEQMTSICSSVFQFLPFKSNQSLSVAWADVHWSVQLNQLSKAIWALKIKISGLCFLSLCVLQTRSVYRHSVGTWEERKTVSCLQRGWTSSTIWTNRCLTTSSTPHTTHTSQVTEQHMWRLIQMYSKSFQIW